MDDTLYLERDYVRSGFRAAGLWARTNLQIPDFFARAWAAFEGGARARIFDQVLIQCGLRPRPELIAKLVDVYRSHEPDIRLLDDARRCLDRLRGRAVLAVVTDGPLESQIAKASALRLAYWVETILPTATLGEGYEKPSPKAFELIEQETGHRGSACVYIADNPAKDFQGPKSLGWKTIRVRRAGGLHYSVGSGPDIDFEVNELSKLETEFSLPPASPTLR